MRSAEAAVLIVAGEAARVSGPELAARSEPVAVGSLLGEVAMLVETTYGSTVVARTAVRAVHITRDGMQEQMLADPALADRLVQNLANGLRSSPTSFAASIPCLARRRWRRQPRRPDEAAPKVAAAQAALPVPTP